jgi:pimeloyl-ACP methyl ester carboxylesterase
MPCQEQNLNISGINTFYKEIGKEGFPFFILHGWGASSDSWQRVGEMLAKNNFRVIIPDLPGFGKSEKPKIPWGLTDYADWLKEFIKKIQISESKAENYLLGHSFGGRISIKFASQNSENLNTLILVSSAGIKKKTSPFLRFLANFFDIIFSLPFLDKFKPPLRSFSYRYILRKTDYLKAKGVMKEIFKKVIEEDLLLDLQKIKIPTLILWGEKDKITPLKDAYIMKREIKNSKLVVLEETGHAPNLQNPDFLTQKILKNLPSTVD